MCIYIIYIYIYRERERERERQSEREVFQCSGALPFAVLAKELVSAAAEGGLGGLADAWCEEIVVDVEAPPWAPLGPHGTIIWARPAHGPIICAALAQASNWNNNKVWNYYLGPVYNLYTYV